MNPNGQARQPRQSLEQAIVTIEPGRRAAGDLAFLGVGMPAAHMLQIRDVLAVAAAGVGVWAAEYTRDAYVTAALFADLPVPVIGTAVAQAFPRSPLVTAHAALDIDELSGGRFALGLGSQVARANRNWHGIDADHPVQRLTDYVRALRAAFTALNGGEASFESQYYRFNLRGRVRTPTAGRTPPIYLAAVQSGMARAAGAVADGLIGHMLATPDFLHQELLPAARAGAQDAGRSGDRFEVLLYRCCVPSDTAPEAEQDARRQVGFYAATKTYFPALAAMGFARQAEHAQRALADSRFDDLAKAVDDSMLQAFAVVGTTDQCIAQLPRVGAGLDRLLLFPPYLNVGPDRLRDYHEAVLAVLVGYLNAAG
jgi:probable F420-dependent oxidoreductase